MLTTSEIFNAKQRNTDPTERMCTETVIHQLDMRQEKTNHSQAAERIHIIPVRQTGESRLQAFRPQKQSCDNSSGGVFFLFLSQDEMWVDFNVFPI